MNASGPGHEDQGHQQTPPARHVRVRITRWRVRVARLIAGDAAQWGVGYADGFAAGAAWAWEHPEDQP